MAAEAWKQVKTMLGEFGATPGSRNGVSVLLNQEEDEFDEFMRTHSLNKNTWLDL